MKKLIAILAIVGALSGCMSAVPAQPVTPQNASQVSACERDESWHNIAVVVGVGLSASTAGLGSGETLTSDSTVKKDLGIATIGTGVVTAVVAAVAGIEAADYGNSGCPAILGPLPVAKPEADAK